jgi:predicted ATPase
VFLIGPNASGKSNFLDALRFLRQVAQEGLKKAVADRGGMKALRCLNAENSSDVEIIVNLNDAWEYGLSFTQGGKGEPIITSEYVYQFINGEKKEILKRPDGDDKRDEMRLTQTAMQQVTVNQDFREISDFFSSIQYRHILPQLVRDPRTFSPTPSDNDPYGRDLVSQIWNTNQKVRDARLKKINQALVAAVPQLNNLTVEQDSATGLPHIKVNYQHWRKRGAYQDESSFSDGTLRLLALLWSIFDAEGPLLLEEPELSLHRDIVSQLPAMFANLDKTRKKATRQVFVTTHSDALLNDPGIGANEVLILEPGDKGTNINVAKEEEIKAIMDGGLSVADVLLPRTRPVDVGQLSLFDLP